MRKLEIITYPRLRTAAIEVDATLSLVTRFSLVFDELLIIGLDQPDCLYPSVRSLRHLVRGHERLLE